MKFTGKTLGFLIAVVALCGGLGIYEVHARHAAVAAAAPSAAARPAQAVHGNLRQVMETKVHTEYTYMSFTIWHDQPLTDAKMDAIAAASGRIMDIAAHELSSYEPEYRQQGWTDEDVQFFDNKRLQLTQVAEELQKAAKRHDSSQVTSFFLHLDNTCQSCHSRFRKDLSWT
ncbi:MAG TPA: cytochrome c [Candidatus Acidoferrales bacterium]|nr:cytochrome c [Candidatus Acidoferrales bacterium]